MPKLSLGNILVVLLNRTVVVPFQDFVKHFVREPVCWFWLGSVAEELLGIDDISRCRDTSLSAHDIYPTLRRSFRTQEEKKWSWYFMCSDHKMFAALSVNLPFDIFIQKKFVIQIKILWPRMESGSLMRVSAISSSVTQDTVDAFRTIFLSLYGPIDENFYPKNSLDLQAALGALVFSGKVDISDVLDVSLNASEADEMTMPDAETATSPEANGEANVAPSVVHKIRRKTLSKFSFGDCIEMLKYGCGLVLIPEAGPAYELGLLPDMKTMLQARKTKRKAGKPRNERSYDDMRFLNDELQHIFSVLVNTFGSDVVNKAAFTFFKLKPAETNAHLKIILQNAADAAVTAIQGRMNRASIDLVMGANLSKSDVNLVRHILSFETIGEAKNRGVDPRELRRGPPKSILRHKPDLLEVIDNVMKELNLSGKDLRDPKVFKSFSDSQI